MAKNDAIDRLTPSSTAELLSQYHAFVDASPQGIFYCKTWWLEATAPHRWQILVLRSGEQIKAAWPLVYNSAGNIVMPLLTQKLGVLFAPSTARYTKQLGDQVEICNLFLDHIPGEIGISQQFHEEFTNWLPFMWRGFRQTTKYTYIFDDLENLSDYMSRMSNDCRQRINKAAKELEVIETDDLQLMYNINMLTFQRQAAKCPYSFDQVARIHTACRTHAGARIIIAKDSSGNIHACDYMVFDPRCAVSIIQGADPKFRKGGAQRLLDWNSINFAATVSAKFDFEGSVMAAVEPYNRGFGARQTPYFQLRRPQRWNTQVATRQRSLAANAMRYLADRIDPNPASQ
jgi:hypothetical protein